MKLTITIFLASLAVSGGCGSLVTEQLLEIQMLGSSQMADDAVGTAHPDYLTYQLTGVALVSEDGATLTTLFNNEEEKIFRIIDRSQTVYTKDISEFDGTTFSGLRLSFAPEVTGGNELLEDLSFTMAQSSLVLTDPLTVETAKSIVVINRLKWGDTISEGELSEPTYELTID